MNIIYEPEIDYLKICRLCLDDTTTVSVQQTSFKTYTCDNFEIEVDLIKAYECFTKLQNSEIPIILCDECINQLIKSYEFLMKVHLAEDRLVMFELNRKDEMNLTNNIEMELFVNEGNEMDDNALPEDKNKEVESESDRVIEETIETMKHEIITEPEELITPDCEQQPSVNDTATVISCSKYCIAMPRFVLKNQQPTNDPINLVDPMQTKTVKILDVEAVEIQVNHMHDITKDIEIVEEHDEDDDNQLTNIIYACKYCPKAYSTVNHLILHTRKCHLCQFCLEGFVKMSDLFQHNRKMHSTFDCYLCTRTFNNNSSLRAHLKRNHDLSLPANVSLLSIKLNET